MSGQVQSLYAYLCVGPRGESFCSGPVGPSGLYVPLITADPAMLQHLEPAAREVAMITGLPVVLVEFTERNTIRDIRETRQ